MLHKHTVQPFLLETLESLAQLAVLNHFILVGGTALSLQIGNRKSIDIDLFTNKSWDIDEVEEILIKEKKFTTLNKSKGGLLGRIESIKVDLLSHHYEWIAPIKILEGIKMASLQDIAAMKLNAISGNGTRLKDFVDIAFLGCHFSLNQMIHFYAKKYPNSNSIIALKSVCYFEDIDFDVEVDYIEKSLAWSQIAKRLIQMVQQPDVIFNQQF